ncbi:alpha/beta hydrolase [Bacillus solimangrovi]|nr:alpha/beta hydrolase-fold protein [Bacillus solimangrovi]
MERGTIQASTFKSTELNEELELITYLPPSYSPLYKHHIVIIQDGRDYFNLGRLATTADKLYDEQAISNAIFVGIPYKDKYDRREKYHPNGKKNAAYIRFLAHEIIPFLDEQYPTYQMGYGRFLMGDSLGATVSLNAALMYPNTFGNVAMHSPFVNDELIEKVKNFPNPYLLKLYHIIGTDELEVETTNGQVQDFLTPNRKLNEVITERGFEYFYEEFDGNHMWRYWQPDIARTLQYMLVHI